MFIFYWQVINTYTEAVQTVDPKLATGKLYTLWVEFAKFYENAQQIDDASIFSSYFLLKNIKCCFFFKIKTFNLKFIVCTYFASREIGK